MAAGREDGMDRARVETESGGGISAIAVQRTRRDGSPPCSLIPAVSAARATADESCTARWHGPKIID